MSNKFKYYIVNDKFTTKHELTFGVAKKSTKKSKIAHQHNIDAYFKNLKSDQAIIRIKKENIQMLFPITDSNGNILALNWKNYGNIKDFKNL